MKVIPIALANHQATKQTTMAYGLRVTRADGAVYGFTSHDLDTPPIEGLSYLSRPGMNLAQIAISAGLAVGNTELVASHDETVFTTAEIWGRVWSKARFLIFRYNWASVGDGTDKILAGLFGELDIRQKSVVVELRDLRQFWQQPIGDETSPGCRYRLGSTDPYNGGLCMKDISAAPYTRAFTITGSPAPTQQIFRASALTDPADWFGEGYVRWTLGANTGITMKVKAYAADGTFTLALPMYSVVAVGDQGIAVVGCRKRWAEDCRDKFNNLLNFGGEKDAPGLDKITSSASVAV